MSKRDQILRTLHTLFKTQNDILHKVPASILYIDSDGLFLMANQSAKQRLGFDPVGKKIHDVFKEDVAKRRMENILKALSKEETIVDKDERDFRHFLTCYHPLPTLNTCVVVATEITQEVRIRNALQILEEIRSTISNISDLKNIVEKVGNPLLRIEGVTYARVELLNDSSPVVWERGEPSQYEVTIPLTVLGENAGEVALSLEREMLDEEKAILQAGLDDVTYYIRIREMERALSRNVSEIARLVDGIRDPLTAILLSVEMNDSKIYESVKAQVDRIKQLLDSLEERWGESERILGDLRELRKR